MDKRGWTYKKISDVCKKASSSIVLNRIENNTGDYPLYGASGYVKSIDFYHMDREYIGIVKDGSGVGRVNIYPAKTSLVGTMQYILPNDDVYTPYISYSLQSLHLDKYVHGAAIPHIYFKDYGKELIPVPSKETQQQIVAELDEINDSISLLQEQVKDLDSLIQSTFYDMFGDPVENEKGWEVKKLGGHIKITGGYAFKSDQFTSTGIPVLRIGNINAGYFKDINMVFWEDDMSLKRYEIFPGDLVMSLTGTVGKSDYGNVCMIDEHFPKYYLNQRNAKIDIISGLDKFYLKSILGFDVIKSKLTGISRGVRQANISNKDIENLILPIPPLLLQQSFADKVLAIEKAKEKLNVQIDELQTLLASRMQYWFE